ncbi:MAG: hypothetical protein VCF24_22365 [Candidatus Latescibacterota bacterium]
MEIQKDFSELLELFNEHDVAYAIVGGYALAFHGSPRNTGDIDILVRPDRETRPASCAPWQTSDLVPSTSRSRTFRTRTVSCSWDMRRSEWT